jgi:prophage antirepressor-like protein
LQHYNVEKDVKIMENNLPQIFIYQQSKIRTVMIDGEPWFVAKDVADVLQYSETNAMKKRLDDDEFVSAKMEGMNANQLFVNESGLYSAILGSQRPEAKPFKKWVTHELIPTIRKTGAYITDRADPTILREKANEIEKLSDVNILAQTLLPIYAAAGMKPEFQLMAAKQFYKKANIDIPTDGITTDKQLFDADNIARSIGIFSTGGKPHGQAVHAILSRLEILPDEKELVPYTRNGHSGTAYQYTASVNDKVRKWLLENGYPDKIESTTSKIKRTYNVVYKTDRGLTA